MSLPISRIASEARRIRDTTHNLSRSPILGLYSAGVALSRYNIGSLRPPDRAGDICTVSRYPATPIMLSHRAMQRMLALASAASLLPPVQRNAVLAVGAVLVSTRILLLAHWTSDVVLGLALGAVLERGLRFITGFDQMRRSWKIMNGAERGSTNAIK